MYDRDVVGAHPNVHFDTEPAGDGVLHGRHRILRTPGIMKAAVCDRSTA
jgi:hypothetical protein